MEETLWDNQRRMELEKQGNKRGIREDYRSAHGTPRKGFQLDDTIHIACATPLGRTHGR
jgi:hypothetical protein